MASFSLETVKVSPDFDLELLMSTSQESRIGGEMMEGLSSAWDEWCEHAHAIKITTDNATYLLAYLDEEVEEEVDIKWEETPSDAFLYNALAQVMCMGVVHALLPEVEDAGCAAAPEVTDELTEALEEAGVPYLMPGEPTLSRRYAVVTYYPYRGGCEVCSLQKECPKGSGSECGDGGPFSVLLPGFE